MAEERKIQIIESGSENNQSLKSKRRTISPSKNLLGLLVLLAIAGAITGILLVSRDNSPIPKNIQKSINFALYYPSPLPVGYSLEEGSAKVESDVIFYVLRAGDRKVSISEQAAPATPPDFKQIQSINDSFKATDTIAGQAIIGISDDSPVAILVTNTTLVNIRGSKNVPNDVVSKIAQNMSSF